VAEFEADVDGSMESLPRLSRRRGAGAASAFWTWRTALSGNMLKGFAGWIRCLSSLS